MTFDKFGGPALVAIHTKNIKEVADKYPNQFLLVLFIGGQLKSVEPFSVAAERLRGTDENFPEEEMRLAMAEAKSRLGDNAIVLTFINANEIRHERDLWGHDVAHEWAWWSRQARFHLEKSVLER